MLRTARQYDPETDTVIMADGKAYTRTTISFAGLENLVPPMFDFCGALGDMRLDNAEFGLLTCISLFSGKSLLLLATCQSPTRHYFSTNSATESFIYMYNSSEYMYVAQECDVCFCVIMYDEAKLNS